MLKKILLLEHDEDDVYITSAVFQELGLDVELQVVGTSEELFAVLNKAVGSTAELPSIIMLNYDSVPDGALTIVRALKSDQKFKAIPVVVGCGVVNDNMVSRCYAEGVNSFIKKPDTTDGIKKSVSTFVNYWREAVLLPR